MTWLDDLKRYVERKPLIVLRIDDDEWNRLSESRYGLNEFTIARSHQLLRSAKYQTICLVIGKNNISKHAHIALVTSRQPVTTLETRIKVKRGTSIEPETAQKLGNLLTDKKHARSLKTLLRGSSAVLTLTPKLSSHLIERLASIETNLGGMCHIAEALNAPKRFDSAAGLEEDALHMAFRAFGLSSNERAQSLDLVRGRGTGLARISVLEDGVIEHDARSVPGYDLIGSDLTGRAVFQRGSEQLEIYTANRRPLEKLFGVDLIYMNITRRNIVMVQYKMLEHEGGNTWEDWVYRPDSQLDEEIGRMKRFAIDHGPGQFEYRLNPAVFYLKFVRRDGSISNGGIVVPIDHYEKLRQDPACLGPKGGVRVSFDSLSGRYMHQGAFLDLVRSGYIGAHATTTEHLKTLVDHTLVAGRGIIAAIQTDTSPVHSDDMEGFESMIAEDFNSVP